jgi:molybdopterin-guanine dinucleotide biosynthesis protein B
MKVIAVVGSSGSGKTKLIESLIAEFRKRNSRPAVVKHCPHGFDPEDAAKDSQRFLRAGAAAAILVGPGPRATVSRSPRSSGLLRAAHDLFLEADVVLVEGGSRTPGLKKIEVRSKGVPAKPVAPEEDVIAYVSEGRIKTDKPVFRPGEVCRIAGFIDRSAAVVGPKMRLEVDGRDVPLDPPGQEIMENLVLGLTAALPKGKARPRRVVLTLERSDRAAQKA